MTEQDEKNLVETFDMCEKLFKAEIEAQEQVAQIGSVLNILAASAGLLLGFSEKAVRENLIRSNIIKIMGNDELDDGEKITKLKDFLENGINPALK